MTTHEPGESTPEAPASETNPQIADAEGAASTVTAVPEAAERTEVPAPESRATLLGRWPRWAQTSLLIASAVAIFALVFVGGFATNAALNGFRHPGGAPAVIQNDHDHRDGDSRGDGDIPGKHGSGSGPGSDSGSSGFRPIEG